MKKFYIHFESDNDDPEYTKVFKFTEETNDELEKYIFIFIEEYNSKYEPKLSINSIEGTNQRGKKILPSTKIADIKNMDDIFLVKTKENEVIEMKKETKEIKNNEENIKKAENLKNEGNSLFASENYEEAIEKYSEAIKLHENSIYFSNRGEAYIRLKKFKDALDDTNTAVKLDPKNHKALFRKGVSLFNLKDFKASRSSFVELSKFQNLGKTDLENAKKWIQKSDEEIKAEEEKNTKKNSIESNKNPKKPNQSNQTKEIDESDIEKTFSRDHIIIEKLKKEGNFVEAIKHCQNVLKENENDFVCLHNLGILYLNASKPGRASEYFERSVKVMPSIEGYKKLAEAFFENKEYKKSLAICQLAAKAIEDNKENEEHLTDFTLTACYSLFEEGELDSTLQLVTNILSKNDQNHRACFLYGDILLKRRNYSEAIRVFLRSLIYQTKDEKVKRKISEISMLKNVEGKTGVELILGELSEDKSPTSSLLIFFANMIKDNGAIEESKLLFQKALSMDPSNVSILLNLVHIVELFADYELAISLIRDFFSQNGQVNYQNSVFCKDLLPILQELPNLNNIAKKVEKKETEKCEKIMNEKEGKKGEPKVSDKELDLMALYCTIAKILYLKGQFETIIKLGKKIEKVREGWEFHKTSIRNEHAYYCFVSQLIEYHSLPLPLHLRPIYVVGDSHCFSSGWKVIKWKGEERILIPKLVTGLKIWHLREESVFFPKRNFWNVINTIPKNSDVILLFGEIDCREGILSSLQKARYDTLDEAFHVLMNIYEPVIKILLRDFQFNLFFSSCRPCS
eukprot:TRINITY_DN3808_c0_g1_i2.p1 TRINITY_DN3808_c0_g1~~TRINITY_DN3808_c0_g1_i2.p1  ORF type:complete len:799 (+),score=256.44 TRINITY_DN3808_c0_g1_i2:103-2499(+)